MKTPYTIERAMQDVADALREGSDYSACTIRCAINDALDAADKSGFEVDHDYNQPQAVEEVKAMLGRRTL